MKKLLPLTALLALTGCAFFRATTTTYDTAGNKTGSTSVVGYSLFDASGQISKVRASSGQGGTTNNVFPAGVYVGEAAGNSTTTNATATLNALSNLLGKIPW